MASGRGEEARPHDQGRDEEEEEEYIDMDLTFAASAAGAGREFEFHHMSAPLDGRAGDPLLLPLASPADELFYKGKLLPLHMPPRVQMVEDLLLDHCAAAGVRGRGRHHLAVSTAPATPCERSRGASPANSCFVSGELNVEEFFRDYAAGMAYADDGGASAAGAGEKRPPWSRRLRFVTRQLNLGRQLKASKAYLKTMFATPRPTTNADDDKNVLAAKDLPSHSHGHVRAWRKNPFGQTRSNRCIAEKSSSGSGHAGGHRRSFSSVMVRYSASNKTSPAPAPSSCSSASSSSKSSTSTSSSVRSSSGSDGAGAPPALRRSSSASSEAENPIQGLIAYCKKSQQLASVRKSASDTGFRFLSSSAASKVAAESEGLDELIEICRG